MIENAGTGGNQETQLKLLKIKFAFTFPSTKSRLSWSYYLVHYAKTESTGKDDQTRIQTRECLGREMLWVNFF